MSILKKLFHQHEYKTICYNLDLGIYTKKCKICGYKQRVKIVPTTHYKSLDEIAEWAGDSNYFLTLKP